MSDSAMLPTAQPQGEGQTDAKMAANVNKSNDNVNTTADKHFDAAAKSVPLTQPHTVLSNLPDLSNIDRELFPDCFMTNMNYIYQFGMKDIQDVIEKRSFADLSNLRDMLFAKFQSIFPDYTEKFLVNRKINKTISSDIVQLGYCIVNESITKDIEKVTCVDKNNLAQNDRGTTPTTPNPTPEDLQDITQLILLVCNLRQELSQLKNTVTALQKEHSSARNSREPSDSNVAGPSGVTSPIKNDNSSIQQVTPVNAPDVSVIPKADTEATLKAGVGTLMANALKSHGSSRRRSPSSSSSEAESVSDSNTMPDMNMTIFESRRKRKERKKKSTPAKPIKPAPVPSSSNLGAKPSPSATSKEVYVGNVDPSINATDVSSHLQAHNLQIKRENIRVLANGPKYHSFCITVSADQYNKVLRSGDNSIWPKGLKVRPFSPKNKNPSPQKLKAADTQRNRPNFKSYNNHPNDNRRGNYKMKSASANFRPRRPNNNSYHTYDNDNYWLRQNTHDSWHDYYDRPYFSKDQHDWPSLPERDNCHDAWCPMNRIY